MITKNFTLLSCIACIALSAYAAKDHPTPITEGKAGNTTVLLDCDTVMTVDGYTVRLIRDNGEDVYAGLALFSDETKGSVDKNLLDRIETDLYMSIMQKSANEEVIAKIVKGDLTEFRSITPETPCTITTSNAKNMMVQWTVNGKTIEVAIPVSYETAKGNNRSETESLLIRKIRESNGKRNPFHVEESDLESYGENLYVLPGGSYQNKEITRNIYLDSGLKPVWDAEHPAESLANLFIFPSDKYSYIMMNLTVLRHEYGEKESVTIPLSNVLSEMEKEGCVSYWGAEGMKDSILEGALFFFNPKQGYDHVLKIECRPQDVIDGKGTIKARASLYIPTNNVDNLYVPYQKKSEKEKIRYGK